MRKDSELAPLGSIAGLLGRKALPLGTLLLCWGCGGDGAGLSQSPNGGGLGAGAGAATGGVDGGFGAGSGSEGPGSTTVPTDTGFKILHRLNNAEYNNTVRDLFHTDARPADAFVGDGEGAGFDNIAEVLSLSATQMDMYAVAADGLVSEALSDTQQRQALASCDVSTGGVACAREILARILPRAFRRPVTEQEVSRHLAIVELAIDLDFDAEEGLRSALEAALISSHFLFRVELDPGPASHPLSGYELASRLSYFLWSSMPDEELFRAAEAGELSDSTQLEAQVVRMLQDEKASALVENFAGQWLGARRVDRSTPDVQTFPDFDDELRTAMRRETELLFEDVVKTEAPLSTLLTADYTFLNDRLAAHYGLPLPGSDQPQRVSLAGNEQRVGVLTHAGLLTATSHPRHTSPVNRGVWVLDHMMCIDIPPPPPTVDIAGFAESDPAATTRERLEAHASSPACENCHRLMDPIGFAFEHYDPVGRYRETEENGSPIDATGTLSDGRSFSGARELIALLADDPMFSECVSKKLFTYAMGREPSLDPSTFDPSLIASLAELVASGAGFSALATSLVTSVPFTQRRAEGAAQ